MRIPEAPPRQRLEPTEGPHTGGDLVRLAGLSVKQVHSWCLAGVFGPDHMARVGSGNYRRFTAADVTVARAVRRASDSFGRPTRHGSFLTAPVMRSIADQVRAGSRVVEVRLGDWVTLTVDVTDLWEEAA